MYKPFFIGIFQMLSKIQSKQGIAFYAFLKHLRDIDTYSDVIRQ